MEGEINAGMWANDRNEQPELLTVARRMKVTLRNSGRAIMTENPGKAGPKGALEPDVQRSIPGNTGKPPKSGAPGAEGNNTRRDFMQLPKKGHGKRQ